MALTRDFKETVAARVQSDPAIAQALLDEAISLFVNGEPESAKLILRDLVNATIGFESLAEQIHKPARSLHRMLSQSGNPTMSNISAVFAAIKRALKAEAPPPCRGWLSRAGCRAARHAPTRAGSLARNSQQCLGIGACDREQRAGGPAGLLAALLPALKRSD